MNALIVRELRALRRPGLVAGGLVWALGVAFASTLLSSSLSEETTGEREVIFNTPREGDGS